MDQVEALQGDLALGGLGGRFHEVLRGQAAQIGFRRLFVGDPQQRPG
jgi:hypothetical protein